MDSSLAIPTKDLLSLRGDAIVKAERQVDFPAIIRSSEPSVQKIKLENNNQLYDYAVACATQYLNICYPNQLHLAPVIASDLIETRITWKAADFIYLFKFLRQRQDIEGLRVMGNTLTMPKFMEMVSVYDSFRVNEFERFKMEESGKHKEKDKERLSPEIAKKLEIPKYKPTGDEKMGKEMERVRNQLVDRRILPQNHKDFFEK